MDIRKLHNEFCEHGRFMEGYRDRTIQSYKEGMRFFLQETGINLLEEATPKIIYQFFYNGRKNRNWSDGTFAHYKKVLTTFFNWCRKRRYIKKNPAAKLNYHRRNKDSKNVNDIQPLSQEEASRLLELSFHYSYYDEFLRYRNQAIIATFLYTGLRRNELLNLQLTDVDFRLKKIFVYDGKGGKNRSIPFLVPELEPILQSYLRERRRLKKTCPHFFASCYLNMGITKSCLRVLFSLFRRESKISFSCQKLRTTFATFMARAKLSPYTLQKVMGHTKLETTMRYYVYVDLENVPYVDLGLQDSSRGGKQKSREEDLLSELKDFLKWKEMSY